MRKNMGLHKELKSVGATAHEVEKLSETAKLVGGIKMRGLSPEAKRRLAPFPEAARQKRFRLPQLSFAWKLSMASGLAAACFVAVAAQKALPGSILYPVKRGTETARTLVQPSYNDVLVEKREDEVQQLRMHEQADPLTIEEAEKKYQNTLKRSLEKRGKKEVGSIQDLPDRLRPRYDWSRSWFQSHTSNKEKPSDGNNRRQQNDASQQQRYNRQSRD